MQLLVALLSSAALLLLSAVPQHVEASAAPVYTIYDDASWAVRSSNLSTMLGEHTQALYNRFIETCMEAAGENGVYRCGSEEQFRMEMNRNQPLSVRNYTALGYKKIRAPEKMFAALKEFWETNKDEQVNEWGAIINTYHNMWESPPWVILVGNETLKGGGRDLQNEVWDSAREVLEEWTGQRLTPCSLYGIRIYRNNSILTPHVDRFPLVSSAIINVDQDVDEPWPLEVYGHDGIARNVTMEPGDMVLYESHSVIHGRPFPMRGRYFANIFIHFEPVGPLEGTPQRDEDLPPYLIKDSPWEEHWRKDNPDGWHLEIVDPHEAARSGNLRGLQDIALADPDSLHTPDENGWHPIHESVRAGQLEAVKLLLEHGADMDEQTNYGEGYTLLRLAKHYLGEDHAVTEFLTSLGALDAGPEF